MSASKTNIFKTTSYEWTYDVGLGDDRARSVVTYSDDFEGWTARCPIFESGHPDFGAGFALVHLNATRVEGGIVIVKCTYEAADWTATYPGRPAQDDATPRYAVRVSGLEEHILSSDFAAGLSAAEMEALLAISNGQETNAAEESWEDKVTSETGLALLAKIRKGNTAVKTGGIVYVERRLIKTLEDLRYTAFYKQDMPPGPAGGAAENWLYLGGTAEPTPDGKAWTAEFSWEWSGTGWDDDLYTA